MADCRNFGEKNGMYKHGFSYSSTKNNPKKRSFHRIWGLMKNRCFNKNNPDYKRYGARGIIVCEKWLNFLNFKEDMWKNFKQGLTIDRINNNGNYELTNCRWVTRKKQANNTRNIEKAKKYILDGEAFTINELSKKFNIKRTTLDMRLRCYGWSLKQSLNLI